MQAILKQLLQWPHKKGVVASRVSSPIDFFACAAIALFPLLYLTLRGWTNYFLFLLFILSAGFWIIARPGWLRLTRDLNIRWFIAAWLSPILAIAISQLFRQDFSATAFDGPSRFIFVIPIFLLILYRGYQVDQLLNGSLACAVLICLGAYILNPSASEAWGGRAATYFVDTITLGVYSLILGLICLISIDRRDLKIINLFKFLAFAIGCYLAFKSQSRSAWTAGLVTLVISFYLMFIKDSRSRLNPWLLLGGCIAVILVTYSLAPEVSQRISTAVQEVKTYSSDVEGSGNTVSQETSSGYRLSMLRVAIHLIAEYPITGLKDGVIPDLSKIQSMQSFYSDTLQFLIAKTGTHNEILAQGVRSGIWGLISSSALFLVPGLIFWVHRKHPHLGKQRAAHMGLVLVVGLFIAGLTIQVFNLKYTSSFYTLMIAVLLAQVLQPNSHDE